MSATTDLVQRLRGSATRTTNEAADTIEALQAERDALLAVVKNQKARIRLANDIITNHCIAMQSALIDEHHQDASAGMMWISNTLFGPGLIPDIGEAMALSKINPAQAWFDAKMAEHEDMRAKQDVEIDAARTGSKT